MTITRVVQIAVATTALCWAALVASADQPRVEKPRVNTVAQPTSTPVAGVPLTPADADAFFDGMVPELIKEFDIAGGAVVVVKDGKVVFAEGYGYADVKRKRPVVVDYTLFRPGSISKLFTWTAVMQQVELGKIDLDRDINMYLDFKIPARNDGPITMRHILQHRAGFEESIKGVIHDNPKDATSLGAVLKRFIPERIYAAGSTPAYSNYGSGLAGYVVERVSGEPFEAYVEKHIFQPLAMTRSTFRNNLPAPLRDGMSQGYDVASDDAKKFELVEPAPAGSLASTSTDMARFMIAHLQQGKLGDAQILREDTAHLMHTSFGPGVGPLNRMALGFYETNVNGHTVLAHGGDTNWMHSYMRLFVDDGVGIYTTFNSTGAEHASGRVREAIFRRFADRYLPGPKWSGRVDPKLAKEHAKAVAGYYENTRRPQSSMLDVLNLFGQIKVVTGKDGTISIPSIVGVSGKPRDWHEIAPFVWLNDESGDRLAAEVKNGKVVRISIDPISPFMAWEPTPAYRSAAWLMPAAAVALGAIVLTVLFWPITAFARWQYGATVELEKNEKRSRLLVRIALTVLLLVPIVALLGATSVDEGVLLSGHYDGVFVAFSLAILIALLASLAATLWSAWLAFRNRGTLKAKFWSILLIASILVLFWIAVVFKLVSMNAAY